MRRSSNPGFLASRSIGVATRHGVPAGRRPVFALGMSTCILIGVAHEERNLLKFLGEDYRRHRERVPMLILRLSKAHGIGQTGLTRHRGG